MPRKKIFLAAQLFTVQLHKPGRANDIHLRLCVERNVSGKDKPDSNGKETTGQEDAGNGNGVEEEHRQVAISAIIQTKPTTRMYSTLTNMQHFFYFRDDVEEEAAQENTWLDVGICFMLSPITEGEP
ncbi:hypothetical protein Q5P01_010677 [Channa striata]|uniref:Uncharacterized protein n=1 Tax=Channa striata TaxID=64152 RepID=A0AA88SSQ8_CHASR|nr:hypothetical protein Q5P01_010677 [Channa striata]